MSTIDEQTRATLEAVERFLAAVARHDVDGIIDAMTEDAVYENLGEDVDAGRHEGENAIRAAFSAVFAAYPDCRSDADELFAAGDKCCYCWTMRWTAADGNESSSSGTDVFTVRDGKVSYKRTYE